MTKEEFLELEGPCPIILLGGKMGLCNHWTDTEILVDVYGDGPHAEETVRIPFSNVLDCGGGALLQLTSRDP